MALVLSDSTCSCLLDGKHYGILPMLQQEGFAVVACGGSLVLPGGHAPRWSVARMLADVLEVPEAPLTQWLNGRVDRADCALRSGQGFRAERAWLL